jgi:SAM-dependent methyltransferase
MMALVNSISLAGLGLKALFFQIMARRQSLPGKEFDTFGRKLGFKLSMRRIICPQLLFNPISSVRYFEFAFVMKNLSDINGKRLLDVSSPFLFGLYVCTKYQLDYQYINLNRVELDQIQALEKHVNHGSRYLMALEDATHLPYHDHTFDDIISISVIEHINGWGDGSAVAEMWRTLKPGGSLILTFPIKRAYEEEFRDDNVFGLNVDQKNGKYFFQRYYDQKAIDKRILSMVPGHEIVNTEIFGEIEEGFFEEYEKRWISRGLWETVKDPYYMSKNMRYYDSTDDIRGMAVFGITIKKPIRTGE